MNRPNTDAADAPVPKLQPLLLCTAVFAAAVFHPTAVTVSFAAACAIGTVWWLGHKAARHSMLQRSQITALLQRQGDLQQSIERGQRRCEAAEDELRAAEERYLVALRGSQDGLWEWDLASGRVDLSPRWQSMLGFESSELGNSKAAWLGRVHPADRSALEQALERHLASSGSRFDHEMRLLHKDGSARWVLSRGVAIRRASGVPYRMVGLDTDVTRLKRMEAVLEAVANGTAGAFGEHFFETMVQHFARALEVGCAFITECADQPPTRLRTLAFWSCDALQDNFEYGLAGTPCEQVVHEGRTCFHPTGLARLFPAEEGFDGYLGMPIVASDGHVLGHLAFLHTRPLGDEVLVESIYRIFTARAAAEMERGQALAKLRMAQPPIQSVVTSGALH